MANRRPTSSGGRVGAATPAAAAPPVQPATLPPATAAVAPPSPDGGRPRRGTDAESPPPSRCLRRQPRRLRARSSCCLRARKKQQPSRRRPLPLLAPARRPRLTRRGGAAPSSSCAQLLGRRTTKRGRGRAARPCRHLSRCRPGITQRARRPRRRHPTRRRWGFPAPRGVGDATPPPRRLHLLGRSVPGLGAGVVALQCRCDAHRCGVATCPAQQPQSCHPMRGVSAAPTSCRGITGAVRKNNEGCARRLWHPRGRKMWLAPRCRPLPPPPPEPRLHARRHRWRPTLAPLLAASRSFRAHGAGG